MKLMTQSYEMFLEQKQLIDMSLVNYSSLFTAAPVSNSLAPSLLQYSSSTVTIPTFIPPMPSQLFDDDSLKQQPGDIVSQLRLHHRHRHDNDPFRTTDDGIPHRHRHHRGREVTARKRRSRDHSRRRHRRLSDEDDRKKRRSLNVPDQDRDKTIQLMKWRRTGSPFVEVNSNGSVRTTNNSSSLFTVITLMFWCDLMRNCPPPSIFDEPRKPLHVLLLFKKTNRFLCVNERGVIYTIPADPGENRHHDKRECVFDHGIITEQYDVYRSVHYPKSLQACQQLHQNTRSSGDEGHVARRHGTSASTHARENRMCHASWYLGVTKNGSVRIVKFSPKPPRTAPPSKTFFYQTWINKPTFDGIGLGTGMRPQIPVPSVNPSLVVRPPPPPTSSSSSSSTTSLSSMPEAITIAKLSRQPSSRSRSKSAADRDKSRPAFPLLSGVTKKRTPGNSVDRGGFFGGSNPFGRTGAAGDCGSNLLSSCRHNRPLDKTATTTTTASSSSSAATTASTRHRLRHPVVTSSSELRP